MNIQKIAFIGGGNMARSLTGGLIQASILPKSIAIGEPNKLRREELYREFSVVTSDNNASVAQDADIIILAVKPQHAASTVSDLSETLSARKPLVISILAGINIASINSWGGGNLAIVRAMPNTPALIRAGITTLFANDKVTVIQRSQAESIMKTIGKTVWVDDENLIDTVTSISGSGPAYFFYLIEAMEQAAMDGGLEPELARMLTLETALGAARLAVDTNETPTKLRKQVTSPGGTTEAAIAVLDKYQTSDTIKAAISAAKKRAQELASANEVDE